MTRHRITLCAAVLMAITPALVSYAQDAPAGNDGPKRQAREGQRPGGPGAEGRRGGEGEGPFAKMNLTDEQKAKVQEVMKAHRQAMEAFMKDNAEAFKAIREKVQAARQAKDETAAKAAMEEMKALNEKRPKFEDVLKDLEGVLTAEQIAQLKADAATRGPRGAGPGEGPGPERIIGQLGLTPEQVQQVTPIVQTHREAMMKFRQDNAEAFKAAMQRMAEARKGGNAEEIEAAKQQLQKLHEGAPSIDALIADLSKVLTPEQLAKFKELAKDRRENMPGNRPAGDRPDRPRRQGDGAERPGGRRGGGDKPAPQGNL